jgi:hypothetical protein
MAEQLWLARLPLTPADHPLTNAGGSPGSTPERLICTAGDPGHSVSQQRVFGVRRGFGTAELVVSVTFRDSRRGRGPGRRRPLGDGALHADGPGYIRDPESWRPAPGVGPGESAAAGHRSRPAALPRGGARTAGWPHEGMHARLRRSPQARKTSSARPVRGRPWNSRRCRPTVLAARTPSAMRPWTPQRIDPQ